MNLKEAMELAFQYLELTYRPVWRTGKGSKENLLEAFSQNNVPKHVYLGYAGGDGIRHAMNRAMPSHNKPKGMLWEHWLLLNINLFECYYCLSILDISQKAKDRYLCKKCDCNKVSSRRNLNQQLVYSILSTSSCKDCGVSDPVILEFDHIDPSTKLFNIGEGYLKNREDLLREISKCEIVCSNCHRKRTAKTYKYYSHVVSNT